MQDTATAIVTNSAITMPQDHRTKCPAIREQHLSRGWRAGEHYDSTAQGAQQALYAYAWNNPANAINPTQLQSVLNNINQHSLPQVALSSYAYNVATPQWGQGGPSVSVTYTLVSKVAPPVPVGFTNPFTVSTSGSVQLQ
jgi:hypothetical protein